MNLIFKIFPVQVILSESLAFLRIRHRENPGRIYENSVREIASVNVNRFRKQNERMSLSFRNFLKLKVIRNGSTVLLESNMNNVIVSLSFSRLHNSCFVLVFISFG